MKRNILFLLMLAGCGWFVLGIPMRGQLEFSLIENRSLQKWPEFSLNAFAQGTYQEAIDSFLNDQLMYSEQIKAVVKKVQRLPADCLIQFNESQNAEEPNSEPDVERPKETFEYIAMGKGIYRYGDSGYLIYRPCETIDFTSYQRFADTMNPLIDQLNDIDFYAYFITTSSAIDFNDETPADRYFPFVSQHLNVKQIERFAVNDFDDYRKYFYKSDHHWNHVGSYMGYRNLLAMLKPEETPMNPLGEICFDELDFQGSSARLTAYFDTHETFCAYQMPEDSNITVMINGLAGSYGQEQEYFNHEYDAEKGASHYGSFYGGDNGEVLFINPENEGNLLVLGNSFDNAVVKLLSHHYHEVRVIDWRYYEAETGQPFDLTETGRMMEADQVLFIGDNWFFKIDE